MAMVQTTGAYSRSQANLFYYKFLNSDDDQDSYNKQDIQYLNNFYTRTELREFVNTSIGNYYALNSINAMDSYQLADEGGVPFPITARYFYLSSAFNESSGSKCYRVLMI